jgi:hypothetical protein
LYSFKIALSGTADNEIGGLTEAFLVQSGVGTHLMTSGLQVRVLYQRVFN